MQFCGPWKYFVPLPREYWWKDDSIEPSIMLGTGSMLLAWHFLSECICIHVQFQWEYEFFDVKNS